MTHPRMCQLHVTQLFKKVLEVRLSLLGASKLKKKLFKDKKQKTFDSETNTLILQLYLNS